MKIIHARNVNDAYAEALYYMRDNGVRRESRNGSVVRAPGPVVTIYERPTERMLFDPKRDANPFFHIFEGIWMLAGRNDVAWISQFSSNVAQFSDDGRTFGGAYGWRWRNQWDVDQLSWVIERLKKDPNSRRAVISMWDPNADPYSIDEGTKDVPCNTTIYFSVVDAKLDMTVCNRSNDIVWGCYGANAVHMSMLQEFVANALGVFVGKYIQFSNDWHMYEQHWPLLGPIPPDDYQGYTGTVLDEHMSLTDPRDWAIDLELIEEWVDDPGCGREHPYVRRVLCPMLTTWYAYKDKDREGADKALAQIMDGAVRKACTMWLNRRKWEPT